MGLQTGCVGLHMLTFVGEHCSHFPPTQAGSAEVEQGKAAFEPLSPLHAAQTPVARLHTGAEVGQVDVPSHPHFCCERRQVGVAPSHAVVLVAVHCTHWPAEHAGAVAVGHA
jgi:hypothetical protein